MKAESRKQKAESRKQKAESRKQKAESRKQKAESRNCTDGTKLCQCRKKTRNSNMPTGQRLQGIQYRISTNERCNSNRVIYLLDYGYLRLDGFCRLYEKIAPAILARDYKEPKCILEILDE